VLLLRSARVGLKAVAMVPAALLAALLAAMLRHGRSLSLTTLIMFLLLAIAALALRQKRYGVRFGFGALVFTARRGSRRFPDGVTIRIATRIFAFLLGGCRGPWLDISSDRFAMCLKPALVPAAFHAQNDSSTNRSDAVGDPSSEAVGASFSAVTPVQGRAFGMAGIANGPRRWFMKLSHALSVDNGYWRTVLHNLAIQIAVSLLRGIRLRAARVNFWRQDAHWSFKAEQFVYEGNAVGLFGSRYHISVNELYVVSDRFPVGTSPSCTLAHANGIPPTLGNAPSSPVPSPLRVSLVLRKGVHFSALLTPRVLTLLRPRRMAIMDDIRLSADIRDVALRAGLVFSLIVDAAVIELCPGYSRSLRAKLPPSAPSTRRPRKPGLLRYWEISGSIIDVLARIAPPPIPQVVIIDENSGRSIRGIIDSSIDGSGDSEIEANFDVGSDTDAHPHRVLRAGTGAGGGLFARLSSATFDACGMAADERQEAMCKAGVKIEQVYAGSTAVETTAREQCEALARVVPPKPASRASFDSQRVSDGYDHPPALDSVAVRALETFVAARPEAIIWLASAGLNFDMNCAKRDALRCDVNGDGAVVAIEPAGLLRIARNAIAFSRAYATRRELEAFTVAAQSSSSSPLPGTPRHCLDVSTPGQSLQRNNSGTPAVAGSNHAARKLSTSISSTSLGSSGSDHGDRGALLFGCDLKRCHAVVIGDGPVGEGDTLALIFGAETVAVPRMIRSGAGFRVVSEFRNLRVDHWSQWARTSNLVCDYGSFSNMTKTSEERREVTVSGLSIDWDLDLQSAMEEMPALFLRLAHVRADPELVEFTVSLALMALPSPTASVLTSSATSPVLASMSAPESADHGSPLPPMSMGLFPLPGPSTTASASTTAVIAATALAYDAEEAALAEIERRERRERRRNRFVKTLKSWAVSGTDVSMAASFPDGPRLGFTAADIPRFALANEWYVARHCVITLCDTKCAYGSEVRIENPIHSMGRSSDRRRLHVVVEGLRAVLRHEFWFGMLLQDWIVRLKAVLKVIREARYRRRSAPMPRFRKRPFPDLHLLFADVEVFMEDHPIGSFLTRTLPLLQDEALEREKRYKAMMNTLQAIQQNGPVGDLGVNLMKSLEETASDIHISRVMSLKEAAGAYGVAPGFIPSLAGTPMALLTASKIRFDMTMDDATRKYGSAESIRKLKTLDEYLLGQQKYGKTRQYDPDAWNEIGFRDVALEAIGIQLRFRDFPVAFLSIDRLYFEPEAVMGQAAQATTAPNLTHATVAIGRRRVVEITKSLGPSKSFVDVHLIADVLQCGYNPAYMASISDFARGFSRFLSLSKNPSPRMPWFDSWRSSLHGRFRITARTLKGVISSSTSPYTMTSHYVDIEADDVCMLASRLPTTVEDKHPISWEVHNWRLRPSVFREDVRSLFVIDFVKVGLNPVPTTLSGDPQDHYYIPFPSKDEVAAGGLGIGRARIELSRVNEPAIPVLNAIGCFTSWESPELMVDPNYDTYKTFKTNAMYLGISICVRHAPNVTRPSSFASGNGQGVAPSADAPPSRDHVFWAPAGASLMHSDGITTLMKVVGKIIKRPITNRSAPRWLPKGRKPNCPLGLGYRLMSLDLEADVRDLNVMFYNNLNPGHGLFVSAKRLVGGMSRVSSRRGGEETKESKVVRRVAEIQNVYSALRLPSLEFADEATDCGFLFSLNSLRLSQDAESAAAAASVINNDSSSIILHDRRVYRNDPSEFSGGDDNPPRVMSSGFGDNYDTSPFYTFSSNHALQRGKKLDKVLYAQTLAIDGSRFLWSPKRRNSLLTWPDAFREKVFSMTGPSRRPIAEYDLVRDANSRVVKNPAGGVDGSVEDDKGPQSDVNVSDTSDLSQDFGIEDGDLGKQDMLGSSNRVVGSENHADSTEENAGLSGVNLVMDGYDARQSPGVQEKASDNASNLVHLYQAPITPRSTRLAATGDLIDLLYTTPVKSSESSDTDSIRIDGTQRPIASDSDGNHRRHSRSSRAERRESSYGRQPSIDRDGAGPRISAALVTSVKKVLDTNGKFQLMISDSQVCFGSPDTEGLVFLTSESASIGFVDKMVQQTHQCGGSSEKWMDTEHRVHLQRSRLYSLSRTIGRFDFNKRWVPKMADEIVSDDELATVISPMTRVTTQPISLNLMFIRSKSVINDDSEEDHILRPSVLLINVPFISMDSTATEFHSVIDVVRKVLMQRVPHSDVVKEELAALRYNLQLNGGLLSTQELQDYSRRLNNITKQFMYAGETFQQHLVSPLMRRDQGDFAANLVRYKAKAKAVATYLRSEHRASGVAELFPTMYVSYSFDQCSWQLREKQTEKTSIAMPFVELILTDLVCRHIFYVGKGSSSEFTFANINAINRLEGGFYKGILHPSSVPANAGSPSHVNSKIKASDGTSVAFRWFSTQMESVGGIPVYDLLTINVAPLNAAISHKLYKTALNFAFGTTKLKEALPQARGGGGVSGAGANGEGVLVSVTRGSESVDSGASKSIRRPASGSSINGSDASIGTGGVSRSNSFASVHKALESTAVPRTVGTHMSSSSTNLSAASTTTGISVAPLHARSRSQDVEEMNMRGQTTMLFRYVYIGEFQLTASYKKKEDPDAHSVLDITDLTVNSPSYMYSSQVWTWRDFARQMRKELLLTFAVRGVSNLAKIKLLPGYQRARRRIKQGKDTVKLGLFDRGSGGRTPSQPSVVQNAPVTVSSVAAYEAAIVGIPEMADRDDSSSTTSSTADEIVTPSQADIAVTERRAEARSEEENAAAEDRRRRLVMQALYGTRTSRNTATTSTSPAGSQSRPSSTDGLDEPENVHGSDYVGNRPSDRQVSTLGALGAPGAAKPPRHVRWLGRKGDGGGEEPSH
jgi:Golgi-body localisation protein domain/RNA pol II promoter Fmp27 protein domain